jgi:hypothetical protein
VGREQKLQMLGSLLAAAAIVAITIVVVTAQFGPDSAAELEARQELIEQRAEMREERAEQRQERLEERRKP